MWRLGRYRMQRKIWNLNNLSSSRCFFFFQSGKQYIVFVIIVKCTLGMIPWECGDEQIKNFKLGDMIDAITPNYPNNHQHSSVCRWRACSPDQTQFVVTCVDVRLAHTVIYIPNDQKLYIIRRLYDGILIWNIPIIVLRSKYGSTWDFLSWLPGFRRRRTLLFPTSGVSYCKQSFGHGFVVWFYVFCIIFWVDIYMFRAK